MDKVEYEIYSKQILDLIDRHDYVQAAAIADEIDWTRVKSVSMLLRIASLYGKVKRYDDSAAILHIAEANNPGNRKILGALCELYIRMDNPEKAVEYYNLFYSVAPKDPGVYTLRYKFLEAQEAPVEDLIDVLEQFKETHTPDDEWMYELAYQYHRAGMTTKCIEQCDEISLYFGQGEYVYKALELKELHAPLTQKQELIKRNRELTEDSPRPTVMEIPKDDEETRDIEVQITDFGQYNTINLQRELAENIGLFIDSEATNVEPITGQISIAAETRVLPDMDELPKPIVTPVEPEEEDAVTEEIPITATPVATEQDTPIVILGLNPETTEVPKTSDMTEISVVTETVEEPETSDASEISDVAEVLNEPEISEAPKTPEEPKTPDVAEVSAKAEKPAALSEEYDGQISMILPEAEMVDTQITGQISIADIMAEWDKMCKENDEKQLELTRRRLHQETETLFEEFDESARRGTLEVLKDQVGIYDDSYSLAREIKPYEETEEPATEEIVETTEEAATTEEDPAPVESETEEPVESEELIADKTAEDDGIEEIEEIAIPEETEEPAEEPDEQEEFEELFGEPEEDIEPSEEEIELSEEETEPSEEDVEDEPKEDSMEELLKTETEEPETVEEPEVTEEPTEEPEATEEPAEETAEEPVEEPGEEPKAEEAEATEEPIEETTEEPKTEEPEAVETIDDSEDEEEEDEDSEEEYTMYHGRKIVRTVRESVRSYDTEEKALFGNFSYRRKTQRQIIECLDKISMTAFTGNLIITGEERSGAIALAKNFVKYMQKHDEHFCGRVAKTNGEAMNAKNISKSLTGLSGGALIIDDAGNLSTSTIESIATVLEANEIELFIILVDTPADMEDLIMKNKRILRYFNARIDLPMPGNKALVKMGETYALEKGYVLDEMAHLALFSTISNMQTRDNVVEPADVYRIIDKAIENAQKSSASHFFDTVLRKRYDEEDRIIIKERDIN